MAPRVPHAGPRRGRVAAWVLVPVLLASGCTGSADRPGAGSSVPPEPTVTLEPRPRPALVRVTRVAGRLADRDRETLARNVGRVLTGFFDDAYLGGEHPRTDFSDAFATFTPGARRRARADRDLLTNAVLGPTTTAVVPRRRTGYLSVLAPYRVAAGVTARVELTYLAEQSEGPDRLVSVRGRLMLTRTRDGGWAIFGYDLTRSARRGGVA